jgi:hypothetical protein
LFVRFHFVHILLPYYKMVILADTELSKWEKPLDHIVAKMKPLSPPPEPERSNGSNSGGTFASNNSKKRKFNSNSATSGGSSSHGAKKARTTTTDDTPLTDGQRRFLDQNITRGGGAVISKAVTWKSTLPPQFRVIKESLIAV